MMCLLLWGILRNLCKGMDYQGFINDEKTASAVLRKFEIIGEAIKLIPEHIKDKYPEVPWKKWRA